MNFFSQKNKSYLIFTGIMLAGVALGFLFVQSGSQKLFLTQTVPPPTTSLCSTGPSKGVCDHLSPTTGQTSPSCFEMCGCDAGTNNCLASTDYFTYPAGSSGSILPTGSPYVSTTTGKTITDMYLSCSPLPGLPQVCGIQPSALEAPTNLTATPSSSSQIDLSWTDNSNSETGFSIEQTTTYGGPWTVIASVGSNVTSYKNTGLTAATLYYYRVQAKNASAGSAYSNTASAKTLAASVPSAPSNLSATAVSPTQINLSWNDNSTNETGFKVERAPAVLNPNATNSDEMVTAGLFSQITTTGAGFYTYSYSDTGLTPATTYFYRVRATNTAGDSGYSNIAKAKTNDTDDTCNYDAVRRKLPDTLTRMERLGFMCKLVNPFSTKVTTWIAQEVSPNTTMTKLWTLQEGLINQAPEAMRGSARAKIEQNFNQLKGVFQTTYGGTSAEAICLVKAIKNGQIPVYIHSLSYVPNSNLLTWNCGFNIIIGKNKSSF